MPIVAEGEFTFADIHSACQAIARQQKWAFWALGFFALLSVAGVVFLLVVRPAESGYAEGLIIPMFFAFLYYVGPWLNARGISKSSQLAGIHRFEIDEAGFRWSTPLANGQLSWALLHKWRESNTTILLYPNATYAQFLPKRFFSSETDLESARQILKQSVKS